VAMSSECNLAAFHKRQSKTNASSASGGYNRTLPSRLLHNQPRARRCRRSSNISFASALAGSDGADVVEKKPQNKLPPGSGDTVAADGIDVVTGTGAVAGPILALRESAVPRAGVACPNLVDARAGEFIRPDDGSRAGDVVPIRVVVGAAVVLGAHVVVGGGLVVGAGVVVGTSVVVGAGVVVGAKVAAGSVVVGAAVVVGASVVVGSGVVDGANVVVGEGVVVEASVSARAGVVVGKRVDGGAGASVGTDVVASSESAVGVGLGVVVPGAAAVVGAAVLVGAGVVAEADVVVVSIVVSSVVVGAGITARVWGGPGAGLQATLDKGNGLAFTGEGFRAFESSIGCSCTLVACTLVSRALASGIGGSCVVVAVVVRGVARPLGCCMSVSPVRASAKGRCCTVVSVGGRLARPCRCSTPALSGAISTLRCGATLLVGLPSFLLRFLTRHAAPFLPFFNRPFLPLFKNIRQCFGRILRFLFPVPARCSLGTCCGVPVDILALPPPTLRPTRGLCNPRWKAFLLRRPGACPSVRVGACAVPFAGVCPGRSPLARGPRFSNLLFWRGRPTKKLFFRLAPFGLTLRRNLLGAR